MRSLILTTYFVFVITCYPQSQENDFKVMLALETYAFLKGQNAALKKVAFQFPALKDHVSAIEDSSKVIFGRAERNIEKFLKDELDDLEFKLFQHRIDSLLNEQLNHPIDKLEYAQSFLEKVRSELRLSRSDNIQKSIISFAYHDAPHQEIVDGHFINFTAKNYLKAGKPALRLSIPKSWRAETPEMSATIQQFTSYDGKGNEKILVVVHDLSQEQQNFVLNEKSVAEMIPPQSILIRTEAIAVGGLPGMMVEVEEILHLTNIKKKIRMLQFMLAHNNKLYCVQGSIGPAELNKDLDHHIKKYEPLFRLIAAGTRIVK